MPGRKNKKINCETWRSTMDGKDRYAAIYFSMLKSEAFIELSGDAIKLYILYLEKYNPHYTNGLLDRTNKDNISMPKLTYGKKDDEFGWAEYFSQRKFENSIDELIEKGFMRVTQQGGSPKVEGKRTPTLYGFSDMWKKYGTPKFNITDNDRRECRKNGKKCKSTNNIKTLDKHVIPKTAAI